MLLKEILPSSVMQDLIAYFTNMFPSLVTKYKVYSALLTQSGSSAPTAQVLENTIGSITFLRNSTGNYYIKSTGLFTNNKTFVTFGPLVEVAGSVPAIGTQVGLNDTSTFQFTTAIGGSIPEDDHLYKTSVEIRVYN